MISLFNKYFESPQPCQLPHNFGKLLPELVAYILRMLDSPSDVRSCLCTHRVFEKSCTKFWPQLLMRYFPYSFREHQPTLPARLQFARFCRIDDHIRKDECFFYDIGIVCAFDKHDPNTFVKLNSALKISNEKLFHTGFGEILIAQENTTIDIHEGTNQGFDLEKCNLSIRIPRNDIISTCVYGDEVYLGASNGDLVIVNLNKPDQIQGTTYTLNTIRGGGASIFCIQAHQGFIFCLASQNDSYYLMTYQRNAGKVDYLKFESKMVGLGIYEGNLYCIAKNGKSLIIDIATSIQEKFELDTKIGSFLFSQDGLLYTFYKDELKAWDIKKKELVYCYEDKRYITSVAVHREYIFLGSYRGSINVLDRMSGKFISTIYPEAVKNCPIYALNIYRDTLYAYSRFG